MRGANASADPPSATAPGKGRRHGKIHPQCARTAIPGARTTAAKRSPTSTTSEGPDMDFSRNEEHQLLTETARRVGERFGLDYWLERDSRKEFAEAFWQAVCDAGLCGVAERAMAGVLW